MKRRRAVILVLLAAMVCPYAIFVVGRMLMRLNDLLPESAYCALSSALHKELNGYYRENGRYSETLNAAVERLGELEKYEGVTADMLRKFKYEAWGDGCFLWCPERVTYMRRGKVVMTDGG